MTYNLMTHKWLVNDLLMTCEWLVFLLNDLPMTCQGPMKHCEGLSHHIKLYLLLYARLYVLLTTDLFSLCNTFSLWYTFYLILFGLFTVIIFRWFVLSFASVRAASSAWTYLGMTCFPSVIVILTCVGTCIIPQHLHSMGAIFLLYSGRDVSILPSCIAHVLHTAVIRKCLWCWFQKCNVRAIQI